MMEISSFSSRCLAPTAKSTVAQYGLGGVEPRGYSTTERIVEEAMRQLTPL